MEYCLFISEYIGCYKDTTPSALTAHMTQITNIDEIGQCIKECQRHDYTYAGFTVSVMLNNIVVVPHQ